MNKYFIVNNQVKANAINMIQSIDCNSNMVVEIKKKTRSIVQNSKMWAMLTDVANQVEWYGRYLTPENWKDIFSAALTKQDVVPNIDNDGFVILGQSTSKMTVAQMADLIELITAFGVEYDVQFKDVRWR